MHIGGEGVSLWKVETMVKIAWGTTKFAVRQEYCTRPNSWKSSEGLSRGLLVNNSTCHALGCYKIHVYPLFSIRLVMHWSYRSHILSHRNCSPTKKIPYRLWLLVNLGSHEYLLHTISVIFYHTNKVLLIPTPISAITSDCLWFWPW